MRRLFTFLLVVFSVFIGFSFAINTISDYSYTIENNNINIHRASNGNGGNVDVNLRNSDANDWLLLGTTQISDQSFTYTRQGNSEQKIRLIPDDGGDEIQFNIPAVGTTKPVVNRTVISAVPKTGPSFNLIGIILASLAIFGGYIYIKKRADI